MRPPGHPARFRARTNYERTETREDLHHEPESQVNDGGQADESAKDEDGDEGHHTRTGEEHEIRAHDRGDRAAGTQGWNSEIRGKEILQQRGADAT